MALTDNKKRFAERPDLAIVRNMNVPATTKIFEGAIVARGASGNANNAPTTGALAFMGIARNFFDNTTVSATTDKPMSVEKGHIVELTMDSAPSAVDIGKKVYYTDNDKVSLTIVAGTGVAESQVGVLHKIVSGTTVLIDTSKAIS